MEASVDAAAGRTGAKTATAGGISAEQPAAEPAAEPHRDETAPPAVDLSSVCAYE
jgi:hypothetical protein